MNKKSEPAPGSRHAPAPEQEQIGPLAVERAVVSHRSGGYFNQVIYMPFWAGGPPERAKFAAAAARRRRPPI